MSPCPYCAAELEGAGIDDFTVCPGCASIYHRDCFLEAGGCVAPGCAERTSTTDVAVAPPVEYFADDPPATASSGVGISPANRPASVAPASTGSRSRRMRPNALAIGLVMFLLGLGAGVFVAKANVVSSVVGRTFSAEEVDQARKSGIRSGYVEGDKAGYRRGASDGFDRGATAGCEAVFSVLSATRLVDYTDWLLNTRYASSASVNDCSS